MPDLFDVLPPEEQKRAYNLRDYVRTELANDRTPRKEAVTALERLNDLARSKGGQPQGAFAPEPTAQAIRDTVPVTDDFITEAAQLAVAIETADAHGMDPRPEDVMRLQEIDAMARARLTPDQYEQGMKHFHTAKIKAHGELSAMVESNDRKMADFAASEAESKRASILADALRASGADGEKMSVKLETQEQLDDFRAGKPVEQQTQKSRFPKHALTKAVKAQFGTSYPEHKARLDEVAELELSNPAAADAKREQYGFDKETTKNWREGEGLRLGLAERLYDNDVAAGKVAGEKVDRIKRLLKMNPRNPGLRDQLEQAEAESAQLNEDFVEVEPTDDDYRHMDVVTAAAEHNEDPGGTLDEFKQQNSELLESDDLHGSVARAFVAVEEHYENQEA